jgi:NifU-like protein involved in Fe-S cluster formation
MYNETILHLWSQPYHRGLPADIEALGATVGQEGFPGEGPYMKVALRWEGESCAQAWFETYSCPAAVACGSRLAQWVQGKTLGQAESLGADDLSLLLGGLPLGKKHCAHLAVNALQSALSERKAGVAVG